MKISINRKELNLLFRKFISFPLNIVKIDEPDGIKIEVKISAVIPMLKLALKPEVSADGENIPVELRDLGFNSCFLPDALVQVINAAASFAGKDATSILAEQYPNFIKRESRGRICFGVAAFCREKKLPLNPVIKTVELDNDKISVEFEIRPDTV